MNIHQRRIRERQKTLAWLRQDHTEEVDLDPIFIEREANKERGVAYTIKDAWIGDLEIKHSANAWWMDDHKVEILIEGLKEGHTISTACRYAGISRAMWQYFNKIHPEFDSIVERCEEWLVVKAMSTIRNDMENPKTSRWFLEHRHPKFKKRFTLDDLQGRLLPNMNSNFGVNEEGTPQEIAARLRQTADAIEMDAKVSREKISTEIESN